MLTSRREFLSAAGVAAYTAFSQRLFAANPTLGLIFPPENYPIPPDAKQLYPSGVDFIGNGVGLPGGMTIEGYEEAIPRVLPKAVELAKQGANVVSSTPHGLWHGVKLLGANARVQGFGMVMAKRS